MAVDILAGVVRRGKLFGGSVLRRQRSACFPADGPAFNVPLPFTPLLANFQADGRGLYGLHVVAQDLPAEVIKVEFNPTRINVLWRAEDMYVDALAVSAHEDKLVLSGGHVTHRACGMFEVSLPTGTTRTVIASSNCGEHWSRISLSPDATQVIARSTADWKLIALETGASRPLGGQYSRGRWGAEAAWSPDGKSIAVLESADRGRIFVLDASDLSVRKILPGGSHRMPPRWSPDSKSILRGRLQLGCGMGIDVDPRFTLEMIDVESGVQRKIRSSHCQVSGATVGWVASDIR